MRGLGTAKDKQDVIKLLTMICDIFHGHNETKQETMDYIELDITMYKTLQNATKCPSDFLSTFKAQIDTIKCHGRRSRYYPMLM